ncbi:unnamed protein product [Adineta steineri]|uniref:Uncharacterized protein n=1 Tax=Adineta steineri TaxID=433720 RepID=A0A815S7I8_9BILA|nr:unnamed protein product [Adineta steineri]CAF3633397.1 unnamed protein product [Adineta steineri]
MNSATKMDSPSQIADQLINNQIQVSQLHEIKELDILTQQMNEVDVSQSFNNPNEQAMTRYLQENIRGCVDTAKNCLEITIDLTRMNYELRRKNPLADLTPLVTHGKNIYEKTKEIYYRSANQAIKSGHIVLDMVKQTEVTRSSTVIQRAAFQFRNDVQRYERGEVQLVVPERSHDNLRQTVRQIVPDPEHPINKAIENSDRWWHIASFLSAIAAIGLAILAKMK